MVSEILEVLIDAVLEGAEEVLHVRASTEVGAHYKDATELVTLADLRSDAAIRAVLVKRLPEVDGQIGFHLEESGASGVLGSKRVGADPLDGTNHFASGGQYYSVQAHYVEDGVPQCGVVFQPEAFLPFSESDHCTGRLVYAMRGQGAFIERTEFDGAGFNLTGRRRVVKHEVPLTQSFVACVPISTKMNAEEKARALRVHASGLIGVSTGLGGAGANVLMAVFGGQHVYANFGAGDDLDLIPPQVIAEEAGLTVWGVERRPPVWNVKKQAFVVAPDAVIAERFLVAAGF